ncbi:PREDICTED: cytochrome P450 3A9-like isoform X1 [Nanorana parkeri]|uniref:cytochrome P450 3A9-like isoform X1 n=1 Tax=Nanorana parkeri TaxID=125878 RepID=UPI0008543097|nr:PREDICTED: cytochrome P450 3A9-like isoform X1 [Nanorana parkeri]
MNLIPSFSSETWILLAVFWVLFLIYGVWPYGVFKKLGVPGPFPLPYIGTFLEYRKGVAQYDMECFKKYGKLWGLYDGRQAVLAILDPVIIKTILVKECYTNFTNRRNFGLNGPFDSALTIAEDDQWKRIRTVLSPTFTSGKLKEMFQIMKDYSNTLVKNIQVYVDKDEPCPMKDVLGAYSMDVVTSSSFGVHVDSLNKPNDPFVTKTKQLLKLGLFSPLLIFVVLFPFIRPVLEWMNVSLFPEDFLNFYMNAITRFKEKRQKEDHSGVDFLQLMLDSRTEDINDTNKEQKALTDSEIMAQSVVFILAGYETTSSTLTSLFYNLATHPDVQQKLQEEVDLYLPNKASPTYDILMQMEYLDMVIQETLRMYPPAGRVERVSKKTVEINGVTIPRGMVCMIPAYVLHNDPEYWPEPEEFRPERFSKENRENHTPYTFLPFGDGPRNCIGMRFAMLSMKVATAAILQHFICRPCKATMIPMELSTQGFMQPKKPIILKFVSRA